MFVLTVLVYPAVLALLCVGAALLVDRASGGWIAPALLPALGAATLIAVSQLSTWIVALAPATPYLLAAVAVAGLVLARERAWGLVRAARTRGRRQLATMPLAYVLALAPVLAAGRPTFSSYMALADSAVHMLGADYLIRHGQDYAHLDLRNSYGLFVHNYYGSSYPSGADTLLGGSAFLLGLPVIWAFQPFCAFLLATAAGPAWLLMRRVGLRDGLATLAALTVTLPALVYAYELIGSLKEIASLAPILALGALATVERGWLARGARGALPFALLLAAGASALGVAFGAWALVPTLVLCGVVLRRWRRGRLSARAVAGLVAGGAVALLVAAWPTWHDVVGSLQVAKAIATTSNPGNLHSPLPASRLLGVWLQDSYKLAPTGAGRTLTTVLVAVTIAAAALGLLFALRSRRFALAVWFSLSLVLWLVLSHTATTWANAKTLMLTSPVVVAMAWTGVAALRSLRLGAAGLLLALLLAGGVAVSDAMQYHGSNLAPTARYEELASIDRRFAGRGPALVTDFDEYALYVLRDLDIGGPSFAYPPPALASAAGGYGKPVDLNRIAPAALQAYPLIVTRRDPAATRPPAAYRLLWQGVYYQVWGRRAGARAALVHAAVPAASTAASARAASCAQLARVAHAARFPHGRLAAAIAPQLVDVPLRSARRPPGWGLVREGVAMGRAGTMRASFSLPHGGEWQVWMAGDAMRALRVAVDGRVLGSVGGQLDGNSLAVNVFAPPLKARLAAGPHTLTVQRPGASLAPGDGGAAVLAWIVLAPAGAAGEPALRTARVADWRSLCGPPLQWVELLPEPAAATPAARTAR